MPVNTPLIITGMHRSGTSMIAGYLANAGLQLGNSLLNSSTHNPHGYFEDKDIVELHGKILTAATKGGYKGWPDWGYTEDKKFDESILSSFKKESNALIQNKLKEASFWGWKDPRTTLLLSHWLDLLPDAKILGIYRNPWEVKQSIKNLNASVFNENDHYAYEIWNFYNTHLIEFAKKHPDKILLVSSNAFIQNPKKICELLAKKWDYRFDENKINDYSFYDSKLFSSVSEIKLFDDFIANKTLVNTLDELNELSSLTADTIQKENIDLHKEVSVVIPCYNQGEYLNDSLNSLLSSRNQLCEIIIINDGSDDSETIKQLNAIKHPHVKVIHQDNKGLASARNRGIQEAKGEYILFLDADNKADPKYITAAITAFEKDEKIGCVYSNPRFFGESSLMRQLDDFEIVNILAQNYIDACTVIRKSALQEVGGFDEDMPIPGYEDWELWINLHKHNWKIYHINEFLFDYRVTENSMVSTSNLPENRKRNMLYLCNKHHSVYSDHLNKLIPALAHNFASMEMLAIERQQVIEDQQKHISNSGYNQVKNLVKKNILLNKFYNLFSR